MPPTLLVVLPVMGIFFFFPCRFVDGWATSLDKEYTSPEQWKGYSAGPPSDVYSLAMIMWEVASGSKAWKGIHTSEILVSVLGGKRPPLQSSWNSSFISLLTCCWDCNPDARPKISQICESLQSLLEASRETVSLSSDSDCEEAFGDVLCVCFCVLTVQCCSEISILIWY